MGKAGWLHPVNTKWCMRNGLLAKGWPLEPDFGVSLRPDAVPAVFFVELPGLRVHASGERRGVELLRAKPFQYGVVQPGRGLSGKSISTGKASCTATAPLGSTGTTKGRSLTAGLLVAFFKELSC